MSAATRVVLVPGVLALLPSYAGLSDPVADLRAACLSAVAWLGQDVTVLADPQGARVAAHLLEACPRSAGGASYLVVGNGSGCRSAKAPGDLDERAFGFDEELEAWLRGAGEPPFALARELWAQTTGLEQLATRVRLREPVVDYADDPFGVQYWVMRWELS